jgi:hypothetical protein
MKKLFLNLSLLTTLFTGSTQLQAMFTPGDLPFDDTEEQEINEALDSVPNDRECLDELPAEIPAEIPPLTVETLNHVFSPTLRRVLQYPPILNAFNKLKRYLEQNCIDHFRYYDKPFSDKETPKILALVSRISKSFNIPTPTINSPLIFDPILAVDATNNILIGNIKVVVENDAELEAALGHEMSHIREQDLRLSPRTVGKTVGKAALALSSTALLGEGIATALALLGKTKFNWQAQTLGVTPIIASIIISHFTFKKHRAIEKRADLDGCSNKTLTTAAINAFSRQRSMFFEILRLYVDEHPTDSERIMYLREHLKKQLAQAKQAAEAQSSESEDESEFQDAREELPVATQQ